MRDFLSAFKWPVAASAAGLIAAWLYGGTLAAAIVAFLIALEVSVSFDNAVINATVLRRLDDRWRRLFLTVGIVIAVFGMRILFPIAIVALATGQAVMTVAEQAIRQPETYAQQVERAAPMIGAFGGMFLLMLALRFLLDAKRERHWIDPIERWLGLAGRLPQAPVLAGTLALLTTAALVSDAHRQVTLLAGLVGLATFLAARGFRDLMEGAMSGRGTLSGRAGLATFLYLEMLDASFSLDGVLGAFAMSRDIVLVALGLGAGAIYVRSLTVYLVGRHTLRKLPYLTHGAHWAIGALGVLLLVSIERHPPEWITGMLGVSILGAAWLSSLRARPDG